MSATAGHLSDPELLQTEWDLSPLADGEGEAGVERMLDVATRGATEFADAYAGRVAELDASGLAKAMHELERILELVGKAGSYAALRFATDSTDPARGALLQHVQERATEIETQLLFFELEWAAVDDDRAAQLLGGPDDPSATRSGERPLAGDRVAEGRADREPDRLDFCRHYLRSARRYRPHLLSEPEEKVLAEKAISSRAAWSRLFGELTTALQVKLDDTDVTLDVALSRLQSPDRDTRRTTAEQVSRTLEPGLRTRGFIYNTLLHDKAVEDRLRSYPHWLASRNLANEASDESVATLVQAVHARYDIPQRWYELKARLLGVQRLADYDRAAPVSAEDFTIGFAQARELVLDTYESFAPDAGRVARLFFEQHWVDAPARPGKRGGAFCSYTVPSVHPYVLLNFTARRRDVLTMAHELGHGLHASLAQRQGLFHHSTPLTLAETASVFGETLVFGRMLEATTDPETRLGLLAERLDGAIATVFRQIAMHSFEDLVHAHRRADGELSTDRINELWTETQVELLGDAVEVTDGYRMWWSYVPHFINSPGYLYAYAYGQLLALSIYRRYIEQGETFVPRYLELLAAGGSRSPAQLAAMVGIDLADPGFWSSGLTLVEEQLTAAEEAAVAAGR